MGKRIAVIAVVLCVLALGGKIIYDKVIEYIAYKGLNIIAHVPTEGWFDNVDAQNSAAGEEPEGNPSEGETEGTSESAETQIPEAETPAAEPGDISQEDKAYVLGIYSRYSASEVNEAYSLMNGEMTPEKKARIKEIVFSKMSSAEYNKIMQLADKYGY